MPLVVGMRVRAKATAFDTKTGAKWSEKMLGCHATTATIAGTIVAGKTPQSKWPIRWDIDGQQLALSEDQIWPDPSGTLPDEELGEEIQEDGKSSCRIFT